MKLSYSNLLALLTAAFNLFLLGDVNAQSPPNPAEAQTSLAAATNLPPPPPTNKSPVAYFRELLARNPAERRQLLADRSPETRKQILAKLREYEALRPDNRELRLKATELRWYLMPLLNSDPTNRAVQLAGIPEADRPLVEARLRYWDSLPNHTQASLMTNVMTLRYLTELEEGNSAEISEARRKLLEAGIRQWKDLSEDDRRNIKQRFDQVFTLTSEEKGKVLRTLSEPEREQIQKTLRRFGQLPPEQRAQCIQNFEKFANLSVEERQQFLKNADRWNTMTPDERQAWRDLVQKLQPLPPVPPGLFPPGLSPPPRTGGVATNHN